MVQGVVLNLRTHWDHIFEKVVVIIYEPVLKETEFFRSRIVNDLEQFKTESDVIVANRVTDDIRDVLEKIYSRDLFGAD